jgi:hypothetical protein
VSNEAKSGMPSRVLPARASLDPEEGAWLKLQ